jgi:hypothetical protein
MNLKSVLVIAFAIAIGILLANKGHPSEKITSNIWETKVWNLDNGSDSKFESVVGNPMLYINIFRGIAIKNNDTDFGSASIQQGDMPHGWYNSYARLNEKITINKDDDQPLYLVTTVKRTSPINWISNNAEIQWNNIGLDVMGDVGLDYSNADITQPHALIIDFYHDTDAIKPFYYQGSPLHDDDYRAGYPLMPARLEIGKEYQFKTRIDDKIKDAMNHYGFTHFTIKYTEYYIEARGSSGSVEARDIAIVKE